MDWSLRDAWNYYNDYIDDIIHELKLKYTFIYINKFLVYSDYQKCCRANGFETIKTQVNTV